MTWHDELRRSFIGIEVNDSFTEAALGLRDGSRLEFCHKVGERWAKAAGGEGAEHDAGRILPAITRFRLNGKHLDIEFTDGSRWEMRFR